MRPVDVALDGLVGRQGPEELRRDHARSLHGALAGELEDAGVVEAVPHGLDEVRVRRHLGDLRVGVGEEEEDRRRGRLVDRQALGAAQRCELVAGEVHDDVGVAVLHVDRLRRDVAVAEHDAVERRRCRSDVGSGCGRPPSRSVVLKLSSMYGPEPADVELRDSSAVSAGVGAGLVGATVLLDDVAVDDAERRRRQDARQCRVGLLGREDDGRLVDRLGGDARPSGRSRCPSAHARG